MHVLEGAAGPAAGKTIPVPAAGLSVGKRPDNDLVLQDDFVSRAHARFYLENDALWVADAGSTNGTFVNGIQVQSVRLRPGDEIQVGSSLLRYRSGPQAVIRGDLFAGGVSQQTIFRSIRPR